MNDGMKLGQLIISCNLLVRIVETALNLGIFEFVIYTISLVKGPTTFGIARTRTDPTFWPYFVRTYLPTLTRPFYLSLSQFLTYLHRKKVISKNTTPLSPNHEVEQCTATPYD